MKQAKCESLSVLLLDNNDLSAITGGIDRPERYRQTAPGGAGTSGLPPDLLSGGTAAGTSALGNLPFRVETYCDYDPPEWDPAWDSENRP